MTNWWGDESHPSDGLVHWSERNGTREFDERIKELRAAWDLLHSDPKIAAAFKVVAEWQSNLAE